MSIPTSTSESTSTSSQYPVLLTTRLILVPTPLAITLPSYVDFFRAVVSDARVTAMGWGETAPPPMDAALCLAVLRKKNAEFWDVRGMGDCGVAELPEALRGRAPAAGAEGEGEGVGKYVQLDAAAVGREGVVELDRLRWVGYAGIRDATNWILRDRAQYRAAHPDGRLPANAHDGELPPWQEMVEVKYGFHPDAWGRGFATEVVRALHAWGADKFGVKRYLGVTIKSNAGSRRVLQKLGYVPHDKKYWWLYDDADEWVLPVRV